MTQLELALWKDKLLNEEGTKSEDAWEKKSKKAKIDVNSARENSHLQCKYRNQECNFFLY